MPDWLADLLRKKGQVQTAGKQSQSSRIHAKHLTKPPRRSPGPSPTPRILPLDPPRLPLPPLRPPHLQAQARRRLLRLPQHPNALLLPNPTPPINHHPQRPQARLPNPNNLPNPRLHRDGLGQQHLRHGPRRNRRDTQHEKVHWHPRGGGHV